MKRLFYVTLLLIGGSFLVSSCGPSCKTCTVTTVSEQFSGGQLTNTSTATQTEERCDELLEMVEENPEVVIEADLPNGDRTVATATYVCE